MSAPVTGLAPNRSDSPTLALRTAAVRTVPVAALLGLAWAEAWSAHGSILASSWLPYAVAAGLIVATSLASGTAVRPTRPGLLAFAALLALAAWAGISALWSAVPALARDESLLTALYAASFLLPQLALDTDTERWTAVGLVVAALGALALATAAVLAGAGDPTRFESHGRLAYPIDYVNGLATLFATGVWPALATAASRKLPIAVRGAAFGLAVALFSGFLGTQSKGAALGLAVSSVVVFAVSRARLRLLVPALALAAFAAYAYRPLTAPFRASSATYAASIHGVGRTTLWLTAAATAVGLAYAILDRRLVVAQRVRRVAAATALAVLVAAVAGGAALFLRREPHPLAFAQTKWQHFKHYSGREAGSSHFVNLGSNRYDFWRVALRYGFEPHPLLGVGARGFGPLYLIHRRSHEFPRRAHSLELEVLAEDGIVGFALLAAAIGTAVALALRRRHTAVGAAVVGGALCWLVQASVDWTWTLPATGIPFFCLLGIGASRAGRPTVGRRTAWAGAAAAVAICLFAFVPPWLSHRYDRQGSFRLARLLDPLSMDPYVDEAYRSSPPLLAPLRHAVRAQPRRVELRFALGEAELMHGNRAAARAELRKALRLDPTDPVVRNAYRAAR